MARSSNKGDLKPVVRNNSTRRSPGSRNLDTQEAKQNYANRYAKQNTSSDKTGGDMSRRSDFQSTMNNAQRSASKLVGSGVGSTNPTAGGSGNSRTWKNHKYTSKYVDKNGKVRYIYGSATRGINGSDLSRAGNELKKMGTAVTGTTSKRAILAQTQAKARGRNTGGGNKVHNPLDELRRGISQTGANIRNAAGNVKGAMDNAGRAISGAADNVGKFASGAAENVGRAAENAGKAVSGAAENARKAASDGADFVKSQVSGAIANTPLKDLFK